MLISWASHCVMTEGLQPLMVAFATSFRPVFHPARPSICSPSIPGLSDTGAGRCSRPATDPPQQVLQTHDTWCVFSSQVKVLTPQRAQVNREQEWCPHPKERGIRGRPLVIFAAMH